MIKTKAMPLDCDMDDDSEPAVPKTQRRSLQQGETVPQIPTMLEQLDMAWKAANRSLSKTKTR
jgi:hypothetical protein